MCIIQFFKIYSFVNILEKSLKNTRNGSFGHFNGIYKKTVPDEKILSMGSNS